MLPLYTGVDISIKKKKIKKKKKKGAIELAKNAKYHNRTKHIDICHHFVRERVVSNEIRVIYCPTGDMVADIITKGLAKLSFEKLRGVYDIM